MLDIEEVVARVRKALTQVGYGDIVIKVGWASRSEWVSMRDGEAEARCQRRVLGVCQKTTTEGEDDGCQRTGPKALA